jgi:transposase
MVVVDGNGLPIGLHVDSAQPHELKLAEQTLSTIRVKQPGKKGRARTRPKELVADKAYDSKEFRQKLRKRGIKPTIAHFRRGRRTKDGEFLPRKGRPIKAGQSSPSYRNRWKVERCFGWMDNCRRLVVRYERHLRNYKAFCLLAIIFWCVDRILK